MFSNADRIQTPTTTTTCRHCTGGSGNVAVATKARDLFSNLCKAEKSKLLVFPEFRGNERCAMREAATSRAPQSAFHNWRAPQGSTVRNCRKYVREDKSVAVDPVRVLGVESHELVPHDVGHRGHAHGGTRVARVGLVCGIDLQNRGNQQLTPLSLPRLNASAARSVEKKDCDSGVAI
jgi:hypothetical protein